MLVAADVRGDGISTTTETNSVSACVLIIGWSGNLSDGLFWLTFASVALNELAYSLWPARLSERLPLRPDEACYGTQNAFPAFPIT